VDKKLFVLYNFTMKNVIFITAIILLIAGSLISCLSGKLLDKKELTLTIGASEKLVYNLTEGMENEKLEWTSSDPEIVSVSDDGVVTALGFSSNGGARFTSEFGVGSAKITVRNANGKLLDTITVTTTMEAIVDIMSLPPMKDQFSSYFMMGNIFNPAEASPTNITNERLIHHYNILTAENNMKPSYLAPNRDSYDFRTADRMVNAALASGFKVHGHTLLWHRQNARWMNQMANQNRDVALAAMKKYITDVVTHFKGRVYSWDVLNEVFPDGVNARSDWKQSMRGTGDSQSANPWYVAIGSDFVYEGFLAARLADPDTILYYNDYNTDQTGKATMISDMVRDINERYRREYPNANRLLIEGIGMQEHHNTGVTTASIRAAINLFRPLGVKISVSELDILGQGWSEFSGSGGSGTDKHTKSTVTNTGLRTQARLYGEYMKLYMENADIIERVSLWGVTDNQSWRSGGLPLLFDHRGRAKPAYYSMVGSFE
jgi:endo-1,4-beta-xylanase